MRSLIDSFTVNGKAMLAPDSAVTVSFEDLDSADSGRDESGRMHRFPVRYKVGVWEFSYSHLTEQEKQYMESLFPDAPTFLFEHPSRTDASVTEQTLCYRSSYGISWKNAATGLWSNYSFRIIEC